MKHYTNIIFLVLLAINYKVATIAQTGPVEWRYGKSIKISVTEQYTPTGITLAQGDTIMIVVEGVAKFDPNQPFVGWQGPAGIGNSIGCVGCPSSAFPLWSAIGKIGENEPFFIGERILISSDFSGDLYIGVNDEVLSDNDGYFVAFIVGQKSIVTSTDNGLNDSYQFNFNLSQNYPNPFNPNTIIKYDIQKTNFIALKVYDVLGKEIITLVNEEKPAGNYQVEFKAEGLSSGIYFYTISAGDFYQSKKMILLK